MSNLSDSDKNKIKQVFEWIKSHTPSSDDIKHLFDHEKDIKEMFTLDALKEYAAYVPVFFGMLKDSISRKYKEVPAGTIAAIAGTLLYVLSAVDVIPDFIPGIGLLDDAAVLGLCIPFVMVDVEKYKKWKANQDDLANGFKEI